MRFQRLSLLALGLATGTLGAAADSQPALEFRGLTVTPHVQSEVMRYRQPRPAEPGMLVQMFLRKKATESLVMDEALAISLRDRTPEKWLAGGEWTWHDTPAARPGRGLLLHAVQRLGRKADEPGREVRQEGLEPDSFLQLCLQITLGQIHTEVPWLHDRLRPRPLTARDAQAAPGGTGVSAEK